VFIVAHRRLDQLRPDASVTGWLLGITRRVGATARRNRERAVARANSASPPEQPLDPEALAMRSEAAQVLHEFLMTLPEEQRLVFVLYEIDGANANEIAEALSISPNTVHSRVRLIREKLGRVVARQRAKGRREDV
jgi:RNA polymerase sigma-70 factor (ECF subfamily)